MALSVTLFLLAGAASQAAGQSYKVGSRDEILDSSRTLAHDLMAFYKGNETGQIPGLLPGPPATIGGDYYFWQGGALMSTMIDYWHLTGDDTYNDEITKGMLFQVGESDNFMPANQSANLGNDDQCHWGLAAMTAAENGYENPSDDEPQWLSLAQNVFADMAARYDAEDGETCDGGLRWQIFPTNMGFTYKNTVSNACFLNLGARLARYTGNSTYAEYSEKTWDWLSEVGFIDSESWRVYDGAHVENNCTDTLKVTFSLNAALLTQGSAFMYNYTNASDTWKERVDKLSDRVLTDFFPNGTIYEVPCERGTGLCPPDTMTYKGLVHRALASTTQVAPFTSDAILPALQSSARSAVEQCTGGDDERQCGFYWASGSFVDPEADKTSGAGEQMSVLSAVVNLLVQDADAPRTNSSAGEPSDSGNGNGDDESAGQSNGGSDSDSDNGSDNGSDGDDDSGAGMAQASITVTVLAVVSWLVLGL